MERPKRKKCKDNPYTLFELDGRYFVTFIDGRNIKVKVEVTKEVFFAFDGFELDDKSQMNKDERHLEQSELYDETIFKRARITVASLEDNFIKNATYEELINAINELSEIQYM